ncbi:MAG TPA: hypothetical protein VFQ12_12285 [Thermoleophilaceae bacterium]|nr:hypothetical protein [Thermoleophilaceae bacterium]
MTLLDQVLEAHGGLEAWRSAREIEAEIRSGGFALLSKGIARPFRHYETRVAVDRPRTVIEPYPTAGRRGVFEGDSVRIESDDGETLAERHDVRRLFPGVRRRLHWDHLDGLYFAGYALWNYLTTPLLLTRAKVEEDGRLLRVTFPPEVPTHSTEQEFHVDERGLITRLDYTAEVIGGWAHAKHLCDAYREFDGLMFPTRRRVTPVRLPFPLLVKLDLERIAVQRAG